MDTSQTNYYTKSTFGSVWEHTALLAVVIVYSVYLVQEHFEWCIGVCSESIADNLGLLSMGSHCNALMHEHKFSHVHRWLLCNLINLWVAIHYNLYLESLRYNLALPGKTLIYGTANNTHRLNHFHPRRSSAANKAPLEYIVCSQCILWFIGNAWYGGSWRQNHLPIIFIGEKLSFWWWQ